MDEKSDSWLAYEPVPGLKKLCTGNLAKFSL